MYYESSVKILETSLVGNGVNGGMNEEEEKTMKKDCVRALIAMIEIWMSDLWYVHYLLLF
jgi:hypothetical protein